jgi:hypothetical protein
VLGGCSLGFSVGLATSPKSIGSSHFWAEQPADNPRCNFFHSLVILDSCRNLGLVHPARSPKGEWLSPPSSPKLVRDTQYRATQTACSTPA